MGLDHQNVVARSQHLSRNSPNGFDEATVKEDVSAEDLLAVTLARPDSRIANEHSLGARLVSVGLRARVEVDRRSRFDVQGAAFG